MPVEEAEDIYYQFLDAVGQIYENTNIKAIRSASSLPENFDTTNPDNIISTDDSTTPIYAWYDNTDDAGIIYVYSDDTIKANKNMGYSLMGLSALTDISSLADWDMSGTESVFFFFGTGTYGYSSLTDISALANWDTSNVTNMSSMFYYASKITDLSPLNNWTVNPSARMSGMFTKIPSSVARPTWYVGN